MGVFLGIPIIQTEVSVNKSHYMILIYRERELMKVSRDSRTVQRFHSMVLNRIHYVDYSISVEPRWRLDSSKFLVGWSLWKYPSRYCLHSIIFPLLDWDIKRFLATVLMAVFYLRFASPRLSDQCRIVYDRPADYLLHCQQYFFIFPSGAAGYRFEEFDAVLYLPSSSTFVRWYEKLLCLNCFRIICSLTVFVLHFIPLCFLDHMHMDGFRSFSIFLDLSIVKVDTLDKGSRKCYKFSLPPFHLFNNMPGPRTSWNYCLSILCTELIV